MAQYFNFSWTHPFEQPTTALPANSKRVFVTGTVCSTIRVTNGIKRFATQKTQAVLSIRSDDGEDKIPAGFRWTRENLSVLVSPVQNDSAEPALIFLRGKTSITVHVEDGCDLIFKNEACQDDLNVMVTSEAGNIESSGGKFSHKLKINTEFGNVTVGKQSSFVPASQVDIYATAGNVSVFLQCCHVMLKSVAGNIRGDIYLSTSTAHTKSETVSGSVNMRVVATQPLQLDSHYESTSGNITLNHVLSHAAGWDLTTMGSIRVNGEKKQFSYQEGGLGLIRAETVTGNIVSEVKRTTDTAPKMVCNWGQEHGHTVGGRIE